jgi:ferredoxin-NADP reductase/predicted pyridoxine 5'-phosphate oxidase superfamily flavin-nucleotide-binding protein
MSDDRNHGDSPFHAGERQVQERLGVREEIESFARRVVRDHMPEQHRGFYAQLPFVLLATLDDRGRPWASLVAGRPGFMTSPDARSLDIAARPLFGDPLNDTLKADADIGLLGIQLETRRRNRLTGRIASLGPDGFTVTVGQAFGNCPQYIQTRAVEVLPEVDAAPQRRPVSRSDRFDKRTRALIERSDTLFIATAYSEDRAAVSQGADVSHRGGKPGFVRLEGERSFLFPDFSGNNHFNTVGNILLNPKAGFLFVDFHAGDLVYMTGAAEIIWDGEEVQAFAGAERLIRFRAEVVIRVEGSLPLRFGFEEYSPMLDHTGSWTAAAETIAADKERNVYLPYEVFDIKPESEAVTSFHLRRVDGRAPASYEPGQFLPIRLTVPGEAAPVTRTYTLSDAPGADHFRLSVKREGGDALVSNFLHDRVTTGFRLEAMAPRGKFHLERSGDRPVVLLSAGVGITPMIAMTNFIIKEGLRTRKFRRTHFIHGARNGRVHAFGETMRRLAAAHDSLSVHVCYSRPSEEDRLGVTHDSEGHVDLALLKRLLPFDDYDFYLCGPTGFMQSLYDGLTGLGVREERIHYESFGPAAVLKHDAGPKLSTGEVADGPVAVKFSGADVAATWSPDKGTLLELAEAAGLDPAFSCRSGVCGTCATRITCGQVDYIEEPSAPHGEDEVLICCSTPRSGAGEATCGKDYGVVLEL